MFLKVAYGIFGTLLSSHVCMSKSCQLEHMALPENISGHWSISPESDESWSETVDFKSYSDNSVMEPSPQTMYQICIIMLLSPEATI